MTRYEKQRVGIFPGSFFYTKKGIKYDIVSKGEDFMGLPTWNISSPYARFSNVMEITIKRLSKERE